jgi:hypothetical protein
MVMLALWVKYLRHYWMSRRHELGVLKKNYIQDITMKVKLQRIMVPLE